MKRLVTFVLIATLISAILVFSMSFASAFALEDKTSTNVVCPSSTILLQQTVTADQSSSFTITTSGTAKSFSTTVPSGFWLNEGQSQTIYTYITPSSKITPGKYNIKITIESNGVSKDVEKEIVVENCHYVELTVEPLTKICSCEEKTVGLNITNKGRYLENYKLGVEGPANDWISLSSSTISLSPNSSTVAYAYVKTPCEVKGSYELNFVLESLPYVKTNKKAQIEVVPCYDYTIATDKVLYSMCEAGELTIPVKIKNLGTTDNIYKINFEAPEWTKADQRELSIKENEEKSFNIIANPPYGTNGNFTIKIDVLSDYGKVMKSLELEEDVESCYGVSVAIEADRDKICNALSSSYSVIVKNTGKFANSYELLLEGPEWAALSNNSIALDAGAEGALSLGINPPFENAAGIYNITVKAVDSISNVEASDAIIIETINATDCYKPSISTQEDEIEVAIDSTATLPLIVENKGTNAANYSIELSGTAASFCQINPGAVAVNPNEAQTIYLYIAPSLELNSDEYTITATARLADTTVLSSKNIVISVTPAEELELPLIEEETEVDVANTTETNETINITGQVIETPEAKPSLWSRFIEWLGNLFRPKKAAITEDLTNLSNLTDIMAENITDASAENRAPVLNKDIPDIELNPGETYTIDLADYFSDPDKDALSYIPIKPAHIDAAIYGSVVSLTAELNFTGPTSTTFYAYDGVEITSSNLVKITLKGAEAPEETPAETNETIGGTSLNETEFNATSENETNQSA